MMINTGIISQIMTIVAILVIVVNIVTEVVKNTFELKNAQKINIFVTILSIALTVATLLTYFQIKAIPIMWYSCVAFVVVGFMVAYAAMFGYDKLLSYFNELQ